MKKPDAIVWTEENGYDAKLRSYPTSVGAPSFNLPDMTKIKSQSAKKMHEVFDRERLELLEKAEKLYEEYNNSMMVWESKISFEPIIGGKYHLYDFDGEKTLSLIAPNEWNKSNYFLGSFILNYDNKWIKVK
jgi:hypothetical protein